MHIFRLPRILIVPEGSDCIYRMNNKKCQEWTMYPNLSCIISRNNKKKISINRATRVTKCITMLTKSHFEIILIITLYLLIVRVFTKQNMMK